jgi:hypothetical protein
MKEQKGSKGRPELKYVAPVPYISHGETEVSGVVEGRAEKVNQEGDEEQTIGVSRVVLTPEGAPEVVVGGLGKPVTSYEFGKITDKEVHKKLRNARRRARSAERKKERALKNKIKKNSG